jgi:hypothetical protein
MSGPRSIRIILIKLISCRIMDRIVGRCGVDRFARGGLGKTQQFIGAANLDAFESPKHLCPSDPGYWEGALYV